ncbi:MULTISPECIES: 30S ribosomal protein S9 [Caldilinea]|jgi:small subunit ribosomal protein S9|uniref:Small ribosomal subunit protein uS9 n=2 Tax=Caldilinea aerophila TaxID=133453 RepID=I0HZI1_CALAS|nr:MULTISPECIES: 30S ribosomal protein S9 [Caldilinea]MBO9393156.1 30S ribosomal protein S9 [Caldilinea sp.]BAL98418.1 30S ribosomal protein S9 [Caldilinea aerophila DSM 14535 = NBRC 104270]GIV74998.1 MAG: 30S ribosomal protein S9 [Caldilinea sp.]
MAEYVEAVGRRKEATARVRLYPGTGEIIVNDKPANVYFGRALDQMILRQPLVLTGTESSYNISVKVHGGGESGQAAAVRLGIARALCERDPNLRPALKAAGFLTRDAREKERKKPGLKRARKAPQYTKR